MNWGGLNDALFSWRNGVNALLPKRSTKSDGARADGNHASTSEHQPDPDGTVDAFDEDRNYLGSPIPTGSAAEDEIHDALNRDFMADPRAHLIISDRKIYNDQIGNWRRRDYGGSSPHTEHTHRQVHQSLEDDGRPWKFPNTTAVLRRLSKGDKVAVEADVTAALEKTRPYKLERIGERGWAPTSLVVKIEYIFEALVAAGLIDADGDGTVDDAASVPARLARIEAAVGRLEQAIPPGA